MPLICLSTAVIALVLLDLFLSPQVTAVKRGWAERQLLAEDTAGKGRQGGGDGSHHIRHLLLAFKSQPGFSSFVTPQTARFLDRVAWFT